MRVSRVSRAVALLAAAPSTRVSPSTGSTRGGAIDHRPVYEVLPGWPEDITGVRIEALVGVPIDVISVGPDGDQTITRRAVFQEEGA